MNQEPLRVLVVSVSYESDAAALRFLRTLRQISNVAGVEVKVVLVDNSERSESTAFFEQAQIEYPEIICLKPSSNLGYFGGARFGLNTYRENGGLEPDWVMVSNVDIRFTDKSFFMHLRDVDTMGMIGVVAPSIWSELRRHDWNPNLISRPSRLRMHFYKWVFRNFYLLNLFMLLAKIKYLLKYGVGYLLRMFQLTSEQSGAQPSVSQWIYAPRGACILFSKLYFTAGGTLDHPAFLFAEEIFLAETLLKLGLRVLYEPKLRVHHDDHVSTGEFPSRKIAKYMSDSSAAVVEHYFK